MNRRQALKTLALVPLTPSILTAASTPEKHKGVWGFLVITRDFSTITEATQQETVNAFARKAFEFCPELSTCDYGSITLYLDSEKTCREAVEEGPDYIDLFPENTLKFEWTKIMQKYHPHIQADRFGWYDEQSGQPATFFTDSH